MKIDNNSAIQSVGCQYPIEDQKIGQGENVSVFNGRNVKASDNPTKIQIPSNKAADTIKAKPLESRSIRTPQEAYQQDLLSLVKGDNTLTQDFGELKTLLSDCKTKIQANADTEKTLLTDNEKIRLDSVSGQLQHLSEELLVGDKESGGNLIGLNQLETDYQDIKGMTMSQIAADMKQGNSTIRSFLNAHYDLADKLREFINHAGDLLDGPARNRLAEFCGNLEQRAIRLESLVTEFASDSKLATTALRETLPPSLSENDSTKMANELNGMFTSVSHQSAKLNAKSSVSTVKGIFSAISDAISKAVNALRELFTSKSLPATSTAVRCANELESINTRITNAKDKVQKGDDLTKFQKGEIVKGMFKGSLHLDRYLELRRQGVSHGMIQTDFVDENIAGDKHELGSGHENTVYIGKYRQHDGSMASLAIKDLNSCNMATYDENRMRPLLQPGKEDEKSGLKANYYASKAAQALKCGGSVPYIKGLTQNGAMKIGMSLAPGMALPEDLDGLNAIDKKLRKLVGGRSTLGRCWPVKTGVNPQTGAAVSKPLAMIGRNKTGKIVDPKLVQNIEGGLMHETNKLEWVDALSGENGRHDRNYMLDVDLSKVGLNDDKACDFPDKVNVRLTGIDNDKSFSYGRIGIAKFRISCDPDDMIQSLRQYNLNDIEKCMTDKERHDSNIRGFGNFNKNHVKYLKTWLADRGVKTVKSGFEINMDKVPPPMRNLVAGLFCRSNSFRKPTFITKSMYDELVAYNKDTKKYLALYEDIDAGEQESALLRLKDTVAFAEVLKSKGRVIDDTKEKSGIELFRDPAIQAQIKHWGDEDEKQYIEDYKAALKKARGDDYVEPRMSEITGTRGYIGGISFYQTQFSQAFMEIS